MIKHSLENKNISGNCVLPKYMYVNRTQILLAARKYEIENFDEKKTGDRHTLNRIEL